MKARAASLALLIFGSHRIFQFVTILFVSAGFFFHVSITPYHLYLSLFSLAAFMVASGFIFPSRKKLLAFLLLSGLLAGSFYLSFEVSQSFFDISYDGQAYHQEALIQLVRGLESCLSPTERFRGQQHGPLAQSLF
jgi:hypothetical protein